MYPKREETALKTFDQILSANVIIVTWYKQSPLSFLFSGSCKVLPNNASLTAQIISILSTGHCQRESWSIE